MSRYPVYQHTIMAEPKSYNHVQTYLRMLLLFGDLIFCFVGLSLGFLLRFETPLRRIGIEADVGTTYWNYLSLLALGTAFFIAACAYLNLYDHRHFLRPNRALSIILRAVAFWFVAFLGTSLVLKFEPAISRLFVAISCVTTLGVLLVWRTTFHSLLARSRIQDRLVQRVLLIGWTTEAATLSDAILSDRHHLYEITGIINTPNKAPPPRTSRFPIRGDLDQLEAALVNHPVDIVVVADLNLTKDQLMIVASLSERHYATFKIIPSFFQIFVSNLRLQTISGVPILGVEDLPINSLVNQFIKRLVDIVGALVGLAISVPLIAILSCFIKRESPGPIFYGQTRVGINGRPFRIWKLRSMRLDAEVNTGAQWAVQDDPRRTKIGTFMRETNLDEIPQFWNILIGEMSLVGPRPERPELIARFEREIPHYNPRHQVRPGLTGWAQVNGLRGNTSLVERIQYDLYYIENWSLWMDLQIMAMTFIRRQNAY